MNKFVKGVLLGVGIGLLVAPMRGQEMRKTISERAGQLRGYLPENEQIDLYKQQLTDRVSQTASTLKDYAQQAASTVKTGAKSTAETASDTASNVSEISRNAANTVKDTAKDVKNTTKDTYSNVRNNPNI